MTVATTANAPEAEDASFVLKFDLPGLLTTMADTGIDGEFLWPIAPTSLALLYRASPEHSRAIQVKAQAGFGGGLEGVRADILEDLCERGTADLFVSLALDLETYGNAFLQTVRSSDDKRIIELRRLPAITMTRFRKGFLQRVMLPNGRSRNYTFTAKEIIHLRAPCPMGGRYAYPGWIAAEGMLDLAHAATRYNAAFFKNNAMPEYAVLYKGGQPTKQARDAITDFFRNEHQGVDQSHRTLVLAGAEDVEIEIKRLTSEVKDGDFLKLLDAARDRIPTAHGVPPRMLGIMNAGQLGGGGEVSAQLFVFECLTLAPLRRQMLDQLRPLLAELGLAPGSSKKGLKDSEVAFRATDLTPPKDDAEDLPALVQAGVLTPEEARTLLPQQPHAPERKARKSMDDTALLTLLSRL